MKRLPQGRPLFVLAASLLTAGLVVAWLVASPKTKPIQESAAVAAGAAGSNKPASGILDGMTFAGNMRLASEPEGVDDSFVFADGTFVSTECDKRCGYPARPYFVRQLGRDVEFVSESRCLHKDAKIVWRGTVSDGRISGVSTWTVKRWYWTVERKFLFEGALMSSATPAASRP